MIRNYLLIAIRNFQKQKLFAFLNMFGLGMGLAAAILIFLYVSDELRYDSMQPYYKNTYRVGASFHNAQGEVFDNTVSPGFWLKQLKETRSEVLHATRIDYIGYPTSLNYKAGDKIVLTEKIKWAEPGFDNVLAFDLIKGNRQKIFGNYNTMVMSETGARKIFGNADPIGKTITLKHPWATREREIDVMVTGVYRDYPSNSHFKPQYIINVNALRTVYPNFTNYMEGTRFSEDNPLEFFESYIVLKPGTDTSRILAALQLLAKQFGQSDSTFVANGFKLTAFMTPVKDLHFDQKNLWEDGIHGNKNYLFIFSIVAFLILLIACINYMNLATARSARRAREVGLRKSLGSSRQEIAKQFFWESSLMSVGSLIIAILLVIIFLHPFNQVSNKSFTIASLANPLMIAIVVVIVIFMAFVSGSYPAIYLSAFKPVEVLKGQIVKGKGAELFRKTLVTIQYTVSLVMIISTFIVVKQMAQMQHTKLNEQGSQLLSIRYGGTAPQDKYPIFKRAVLDDNAIQNVTMANHLPRLNYFGWIGANVKFPGIEEKELQWNQLNVDFDFAKTYQLEFVAGRDFDNARREDSSSVILNETAVKALKKTPDRLIGASLVLTNDSSAFKVIGVVKDFPFRSMHQVIEPLILNPHVHFIDRIVYVKLPPGNYGEKIASIEKKWKQIMPGTGFDYWFVNDEFNRMYQAENTVASLGKTFALLAILITALGVFGLAAYTAEQKTKEIGIRKVLGASIRNLVSSFLSLFLKIFLIAAVIAIPLAYIIAYKWLEDFAYRSPISPMVFILSVAGLLIITFLTVSYTTLKAARNNPVEALRMD